MHKIWLTAQLLLAVLVGFSQQPGKLALEKQRVAIQKEIDAVKHSLDETRRNKKASLVQLNAIQLKLQLRQKEINVINQQMNLLAGDISNGYRDVTNLTRELDTLKAQYEKSVVYAYKNGSSIDALNFIFSATSFNDALKMIFYLKAYRSYRKQQVDNIERTQDLIQKKIAGLDKNRLEKSFLLKEEAKAKEKLEDEKREKAEAVNKLKTKEKALTRYIADKKSQDKKILIAIVNVINKAKAATAAATKKNVEIAAKNSNGLKMPAGKRTAAIEEKVKNISVKAPFGNTATNMASANFAKNQHHLPWPIGEGKIAMRFGPQVIPPNLHINNLFLTFETEAGNPVKVVFDGEVVSILNIGNVQAVIVKHGKYFTTYSNLYSVSVAKGNQVRAGQVLGKVAEKSDNLGELEFAITEDSGKNLDPEKWLR